jgi:hypothetical protein
MAYIVAAAHGLDTSSYTFPYVAAWALRAAAGADGLPPLALADRQSNAFHAARGAGTRAPGLSAVPDAQSLVEADLGRWLVRYHAGPPSVCRLTAQGSCRVVGTLCTTSVSRSWNPRQTPKQRRTPHASDPCPRHPP